MSFIATHRKNVLGNIRINANEIQPGDILEFRYKGKTGTSGLEIVIALNDIGKDKEKKLHALKLENLSLAKFKQVILRMTEKEKLVKENRKNQEYIKLNISGETDSQRKQFYDKVVRSFKFDMYRTYIGKEIKALKLLHYDFGVKQLGLKNENLLQDTDA